MFEVEISKEAWVQLGRVRAADYARIKRHLIALADRADDYRGSANGDFSVNVGDLFIVCHLDLACRTLKVLEVLARIPAAEWSRRVLGDSGDSGAGSPSAA